MNESDLKASSTAAPSGRKDQIVNGLRGVQPSTFSTAKQECFLREQIDSIRCGREW
ncbi:MAG: hypothetical protein KDD67_13105 [Ignavibacteriae bacterium]|nr:hypothetical protein [Ignavibacteriota bacterium]MCB9214415.1 hypothetical protein [Ignavibacteria bacterium]